MGNSSPKQLVTSPPPLSLSSSPLSGKMDNISPRNPVRLSSVELRPLDMTELDLLPPSEAQNSGDLDHHASNLFSSTPSAAKPNTRKQTHEYARGSRSTVGSDQGEASNKVYSARYVTVSAVLSRSGAAMPLSDMEGLPSNAPYQKDIGRRSSGRRPSEEGQTFRNTPPKFIRRKTFGGPDESIKKRASNGSALEALGALLLRRDSSGKVSNLSFTRYYPNASKGKPRQGLSTVSRAWLQGVTEAGAARLGIKMPINGDAGHTIAQRRARKQGFLFQSFIDRGGVEEVTEAEDGQKFIRVGTNSWHPTFEVGKPKLKGNQTILSGTQPHLGSKLVPDLPPDLDLSSHTPFMSSSALNGMERDTSVFGIGSAFALKDPPEAPPSPIAMPGAWAIGGPGWNAKSGDWREEGALLLPPPLLDDQGSDAKSFEGLLGVRRMREQEKARKQLEKLKARNRPAHKVGMLTAFGNFVKAAHAADKASKNVATSNSRPFDMLSRRHTEPVHTYLDQDYSSEAEETEAVYANGNGNGNEHQEEDDDMDSASGHASLSNESVPMRKTSSQSRRSLDSMSRSLDTVYETRALDDVNQEVAFSPKSRRSSVATSRSSAFDGIPPRAPRLLPIHMSITTPNTPFALDFDDEPNYGVGRRRDPSAPPTPRLGPTMLSLPPSPWVHSEEDDHHHHQRSSYSMHLAMAPVHGPPGTPRLAPTALEIAPSPFPTSPSYSLFSKSPKYSSSMMTNGQNTPSEFTSPFSLSPRRSPVVIAANEANLTPMALKRRKKVGSDIDTPTRIMTPSTMIDVAANHADAGKQGKSVRVRGTEHFMMQDTLHTQSNVVDDDDGLAPPRPTRRSFLLWFLFGDLGLGTRSTIAAKASGSPLPIRARKYSKTYEVLLGLTAHIYGFTVFVLAHIVDLGYRIAEFLSMTFWFLRWMVLNLTGQTVLARCVIDAYGLVQKEWQTVSMEDHENKGIKKGKGSNEKQNYKGLSRWQVMKGMIELICLQDVTRERYLEEGAGLEELQGWKSQNRNRPKRENSREQRVDLGAKREADRRAVLSLDSDGSDFDDSDDDEEEEDSSDNDDMVVTRQGPEILEFTKTPKVEYRGYFHQHHHDDDDEEDGENSAQKKKSKPIEANRALVKTIKWASRLAISAYGLHVTLVDLPATFTPSGNRFSRQTFAHLSRLHHEDVLHADIQTLDSDAYSPTFYLVRDLARKVVVVSVRGTQSLQDIIVDLEMVVDEVELSDGKENSEKLLCHAGVLRAAKALISRESTLFKTLSEALKENKGFGIVFTGHSLGGAIASTVVLLLSKYVKNPKEVHQGVGQDDEEQDDDDGAGEWVTHSKSGLPAGRSIRAITFAHPATVNANLANRAAKGKVPLVISVILGSDIIPRCGHGQARELRRVLGGLSRVRKRKGDLLFHHKREPESEEDARIHIVTSWWRWKSIKRKGEASSTNKEKLVAKQIENDLWRLRCDVENDLYAAVKQRSSPSSSTLTKSGGDQLEEEKRGDSHHHHHHHHHQQRIIPPSPWIGPSQRAKAPLHQLAARRQAMDAITLQNEESISASGILVPAGGSILIYNGNLYKITSPLSFFSLPDFHPRMFAEHFPSAYETALLEDIKL